MNYVENLLAFKETLETNKKEISDNIKALELKLNRIKLIKNKLESQEDVKEFVKKVFNNTELDIFETIEFSEMAIRSHKEISTQMLAATEGEITKVDKLLREKGVFNLKTKESKKINTSEDVDKILSSLIESVKNERR